MGSAATGFVKNNKKVTWKEFARMLAVLAVPCDAESAGDHR